MARNIVPAKRINPANRLTVIIVATSSNKKGLVALYPLHYGVPIIEQQIRAILKHYPDADIIVVCGACVEKVRTVLRGIFPVRIVFNPLFKETNVTYSVALGLEASIKSSILIIDSGVVFSHTTIANITGDTSKVVIDTRNIKDAVGCTIVDDYVTHMSYGLNNRWGKIAYISHNELLSFERIVFDHELSSQWFLHETINQVIENGGVFRPRTCKVIEINSSADITEAQLIK